MKYINCNSYNLKFTSEVNNKNICSLDLNIFLDENKLKTKTYFKTTDANSYIRYDSFHYKPWITNILKGQFKHIKRNCTDHADFFSPDKDRQG